jgi:pyruvate/2-oxoglutarate dehydrogenase complex dihydrolipoamide dehydrogenase (E3) component
MLDASHLLVAAGRVPNSDDLGLDSVAVATDERGHIMTDDVFATNVAGIYAVGDVNGRGAFTHPSYQDYEILSDHLAGGGRTVAGRTPTYALFTDPPLGRAGLTETEARRQATRYRVATYPLDHVTRAALDGETAGFVRLLVDDDTGLFIGAAALGLHGDEIVQTISVLMHAGVPASTFATWLPIHPTVAEFFPTIAAQLTLPDEDVGTS